MRPCCRASLSPHGRSSGSDRIPLLLLLLLLLLFQKRGKKRKRKTVGVVVHGILHRSEGVLGDADGGAGQLGEVASAVSEQQILKETAGKRLLQPEREEEIE